MQKYIKYYIVGLIVLGLLASCSSINEPETEKELDPFLNEIVEIEIPMNTISPSFTIQINEKKFNLSLLDINFTSSDTSIIDSSSIITTIIANSINFILKPKIGKYGELQISLIVSDVINIDTTQFIVKVTFDEKNNEYPTLLFPLSSIELEQLRSECPFEIDNYGLISYTGTLSRGQSNITNAESAVNLAKKTIVQYSKFTNVFNESSLLLKEANHNPGPLSFTDWTVLFKNQIYNDLEVINTKILAIVHDEVASLKGHHFNNIFIPKENLIPIERVKEILIGQKYEYECWGPKELEITAESISNDISQNIIWRKIENHIEFRVIWSVPIFEYDSQFANWYVYVDVLSGEILAFIPTFIC